jgi:hypothetical protein
MRGIAGILTDPGLGEAFETRTVENNESGGPNRITSWGAPRRTLKDHVTAYKFVRRGDAPKHKKFTPDTLRRRNSISMWSS